jgi:hypothetical protein
MFFNVEINFLEVEKPLEKIFKNKISTAEQAIEFSAKVTQALKYKVKDYNSKNEEKVTLAQLKKVYRSGSLVFNKFNNLQKTKGHWAMARVNMFLRMVSGKPVKDAYKKIEQKACKAAFELDITESWEPSRQDFEAAEEDIFNFDIDHNFLEEDLYIDEEAFGFEHIKNLL